MPGHRVRYTNKNDTTIIHHAPEHLRAGIAILTEPCLQALDAPEDERPDWQQVPGQARHGREEREAGHRGALREGVEKRRAVPLCERRLADAGNAKLKDRYWPFVALRTTILERPHWKKPVTARVRVSVLPPSHLSPDSGLKIQGFKSVV